MKIKLSKKKPLKITTGAPDGQSQTIPMELERIPNSKRPDPRCQVDTTSESTLPTRGSGVPLFIPPIHLENNVRPQKGTSTKRENDLKGSTNYGLTKERVTQVQSSGTRGSQGPVRVKNPPGNGGGGDSSGGTSGNFTLTKELEETLRAHRPNLDTTGLENSFDQFGQTMFEVLNAQHRTNQKLEEQFHRANETQEYQAEAMQDMNQANFQIKYDHMFAGVPMYDGTDPDTFDDWLYQIETLCELSRRDVRVELMG